MMVVIFVAYNLASVSAYANKMPKTPAPPAKAPVAAAAAKIMKAPDFKLQDENGKWHELAKLKGKYVVLEWTSSKCPFVVTHYEAGTMTNLSKKLKANDFVWLAINSTHDNKPADSKAWAQKWKVTYPTLQDPTGVIGKAYKAQTTPHMFIIDPKGNIAYQGAIDDDSTNEKKQKTNYVDAAMTQLRKKAAVTTTSTKPYGCSVKYKS